MKFICLLLLLLLIISCGKNNPQSKSNIISSGIVIGGYSRVKPQKLEYPFNLIGILISGQNQCTASLIGPDLILTSGHCIEYVFPGSAVNKFHLGVHNGKSLSESNATVLFNTKDIFFSSMFPGFNPNKITTDFAILKLDKKLGDQYGYFKINPDKFLYNAPRDVISAGYGVNNPTELDLYYEEGCSIVGIKNFLTTLTHNCDTGSGDSGSPLFNCDENNSNCYILGLNFGTDSIINYGENALGFYDVYIKLLKDSKAPLTDDQKIDMEVKSERDFAAVTQLGISSQDILSTKRLITRGYNPSAKKSHLVACGLYSNMDIDICIKNKNNGNGEDVLIGVKLKKNVAFYTNNDLRIVSQAGIDIKNIKHIKRLKTRNRKLPGVSKIIRCRRKYKRLYDVCVRNRKVVIGVILK